MSSASPLLPAPAGRPGIRRISSIAAANEDLISGPTVVVPPKHMMAPSSAHETAAAIELAKRHMSYASSGLETPTTPPASAVIDSFCYVFDIDGVLIRGGKPIPEAMEAMKMLNGENEWGVRVPFLFLTNGVRKLLDLPFTSLAFTYPAFVILGAHTSLHLQTRFCWFFLTFFNREGKVKPNAACSSANSLKLKYLLANSFVDIHLCGKWPKRTRPYW